MKFEKKVIIAVSMVLMFIGLIFLVLVFPAGSSESTVSCVSQFSVVYQPVIKFTYTEGKVLSNVKILVFSSYDIVKEVRKMKLFPGEVILIQCPDRCVTPLQLQVTAQGKVVYTQSI